MGSQLSVKLFSSAANSLEIISVLVERSCPNLMNTGPRLSNVFLKFCSILFFELVSTFRILSNAPALDTKLLSSDKDEDLTIISSLNFDFYLILF